MYGMKILNLIPSGDYCGWGVCGKNLEREFRSYPMAVNEEHCDVILTPVINNEWRYPPEHAKTIMTAKQRGKKVVGYGFHEFPEAGSRDIIHLYQNYDGLACGSSWMTDWVQRCLREVNLLKIPVKTVLQGVDKSIFYFKPTEKPDILKGKYVVASAGKFEYRKGQDIVIEVFRRFLKQVPNAVLTAAWDNPWPETLLSMKASKLMKMEDLKLIAVEDQIYIAGIDVDLIPAENQLMWRMGSNEDMANFYRAADVAIFTNRAEAGNNNCLVEAGACGVPICGNDDTGHCDIVDLLRKSDSRHKSHYKSGRPWVESEADADVDGWSEPCVDQMLSNLMYVYLSKPTDAEKQKISNSLHNMQWENTAKSLYNLCMQVAVQ